MSGGFKKNIRIRAPDIIGTRISVENAQLLVSTGAPDFDSVIGKHRPLLFYVKIPYIYRKMLVLADLFDFKYTFDFFKSANFNLSTILKFGRGLKISEFCRRRTLCWYPVASR